MFKNWNRIRSNTFFKLAVTVGVSYVLYLLAPFLLPILLAIALSFALYPLVNWTSTLTVGRGTIHFSRVIAIIVVLFSFVGFVFMLISLLLFPLFEQINELLPQLPQLTQNTGSFAEGVDNWFVDKSKLPVFPSNYEMLTEKLLGWAMGAVGTLARNLLKSSLDIAASLVGLIIVPFLSFYFLKDWRELKSIIVDLFNYKDQDKVLNLFNEMGDVLSSYVNGMGKLCCISWFCVTSVLLYLDVHYALVFGFVALLAELVPVVGPLFGAVPAVFVAYGQSPSLAYATAFFYVVYYQLDANFIMPKIMGQKINLHPVVLIISILLGAKLFGILGMMFAVPVAAVYKVLYKHLWHVGEE